VRAIVGPDVVRGDLADVTDVEGAVVGEVEVQLAIASSVASIARISSR
jgi:hypothetical protein